VRKFGAFVIGSSVVPIGLLFVGYNFAIQYLFTFARQMNADPTQGAASYLENPLLGYLGPRYNLRLLGPPVLLLVILFVSFAVYRALSARLILKNRQIIALWLTLPLIPFLFLLSAPLLSRHLLPMLVLVVFLGLEGLEMINCRDRCIPLIQVALCVNLLILVASL
jgi:hypothetical protein